MHSPRLTQSLLTEIDLLLPKLNLRILTFPQAEYWAFSPFLILEFLQQQIETPRQSDLIFLAFSAGVVGAMGAAQAWHYHRGQSVRALIAVDGWGVPLAGEFPIYRLSHDYYTHWSSALLGAGRSRFYADPAVSHHSLWRSPTQVTGWQIEPASKSAQAKFPTTAATFLTTLLQQHSPDPAAAS